MRKAAFLALSAALVVSSGCANVPNLARLTAVPATTMPLAIETPASFNQVAALRTMVPQSDGILAGLLADIPESPDVDIATARLDDANARLKAARAGLLPSLTGTLTTSGGSSEGTAGASNAVVGSNLQVPIDLFGANRSRVSASQARAEEALYNRDRTFALTRATLSQLYVSLRTAQAQIAVTEVNIASANDSLSLALTRQRAGLETGLGVAQATSNRDAIAARLPAFEQAQIAARLGIEAILGKAPQDLASRLAPTYPIPRFDLSRANITPTDVISQRADLKAAAKRLEAAGLDARGAQRDRMPNLSLSALVSGTGATSGPTGLAGSVAANLASTLFDFGRLEALAKAAGAVAEAEQGLYRQRVFNALADIETQASRVSRGEEAINANGANVASTSDQARLARVRYTSGLSDFLAVLTAERAVYEAQSAAVAATGETAQAEVTLLLALGF
jgi:outer membrane protein, multidrug efflux system